MDIADHNNLETPVISTGADRGLETLGDLIGFVGELSGLPSSRKRYLLSALRRARELLSNGAVEVRAEPRLILQQLDRLSPAMAGLTRQSYANLKSRVRAAFRLAAPHLAPARSFTRLTGQWAEMHKELSTRGRPLSRFFRFAQANGWEPNDVGPEHLERFAAYLRDEVVLDRTDAIIRETARGWNKAIATMPERKSTPLPVPPLKRQPYWVRTADLTPTLLQEIEAYLCRRCDPDPFLGGPSKPLAMGTVQQYRFMFIQIVSALVACGRSIGEFDSLRSLLSPGNVETALRFLYARAGNRVNHQVEIIAFRAYKIARDVGGTSEQALEQLSAICDQVRRASPHRRDLSRKNRRLLEHVDDPAFVDRLVNLPQRLITAATKMKSGRLAASCARDAVAIELLLTCGMRVGNLVDLRLGETIRKYGEGRGARWVIELPGERVKNGQPLRFALLPESERMVELYLEKWHPYWGDPTSSWLFPSTGGGHIGSRGLSFLIAKRTRQHVGAAITCHQFRHLTAELYLREDPNGIGVVSQHLGHRDLNTTRHFYAREQSRIATRRYHEVLSRTRATAPRRNRQKVHRHRIDRNAPSLPES